MSYKSDFEEAGIPSGKGAEIYGLSTLGTGKQYHSAALHVPGRQDIAAAIPGLVTPECVGPLRLPAIKGAKLVWMITGNPYDLSIVTPTDVLWGDLNKEAIQSLSEECIIGVFSTAIKTYGKYNERSRDVVTAELIRNSRKSGQYYYDLDFNRPDFSFSGKVKGLQHEIDSSADDRSVASIITDKKAQDVWRSTFDIEDDLARERADAIAIASQWANGFQSSDRKKIQDPLAKIINTSECTTAFYVNLFSYGVNFTPTWHERLRCWLGFSPLVDGTGFMLAPGRKDNGERFLPGPRRDYTKE